ncbi:MAG TPA: nitrite reductase (NAD(P)H) small subunit [Longimicrobiales bacterium]|nr:nitrite reductase (NAD(P)H) small subunit [Longimicrobiales bacterium]
MADDFVPVVRTPELGPGDVREVNAHGQTVGVTNVGQTYYAFNAACPVDGTNLARNGVLRGDVIRCPEDDAEFDVRTGQRLDVNGDAALERYAIRVEDNQVKVGPPLDG